MRFWEGIGLEPTDAAEVQQLVEQKTAETLATTWRAVFEIAAAGVAGVGTVLSTILAKLLATEKKITGAMMTGIEAADNGKVKAAVQASASAAGVEAKLHKRVDAAFPVTAAAPAKTAKA